VLFAIAIQFNIDPPFCSTNDPTDGYRYNIDQLVLFRPILAWVSHFAEMFFQRFQRLLRHACLLRDSQFYLILDPI
jgi:hypothetical protein